MMMRWKMLALRICHPAFPLTPIRSLTISVLNGMQPMATEANGIQPRGRRQEAPIVTCVPCFRPGFANGCKKCISVAGGIFNFPPGL